MAQISMAQKPNITFGQKILAQSAANKTFGAQLTELQTAFNQLTASQKNRTWIQTGKYKYLLSNIDGYYVAVYTTSAHLFILELRLSNATARRSRDGAAPTDATEDIDESIMYLLMEDDDIS